ncbi:nuclear transport factor 2 family protein [Frateuria hangzhouensis]|uniref:nuclear transport factor 2 family protein n=1 Tax=Frateuria hangzhouensis TaxID=2995589 RepID=UPI002260A139|nr:nuclear transport factor 2 family protein [Frateuria sp. STR12]MCX7513688.1 nuclear transport factor 2 family protein [Frateuria sp. STR12]
MRHALPRRTASFPRASAALLALTLAALAAPVAAADVPANAAALQPVHAFFDAMSRYDQAAMRAQVLPEGTATLMREGKPVQLTLGDFVDHVKPGKQSIEERIGTPQVLVDQDLAVVWAPYTFLLDGKPHHCGTDVFNLVRVDGHWRIAAIADNSRKCEP